MVVQESLRKRLISWGLHEAVLSKPGFTWNSRHTTNTSSWTNIHYNCNVCRFCTSQREACLDPIWERSIVWVVSRALSAVSQVWGRTGLKTRVMNNLLATFCLHFMRTYSITLRSPVMLPYTRVNKRIRLFQNCKEWLAFFQRTTSACMQIKSSIFRLADHCILRVQPLRRSELAAFINYRSLYT